MRSLQDVHNFLFDLDGCIWFGNELAPGASELVATLRAEGRGVFFLTNNSRSGSAYIAEQLTGMGIATEAKAVLVPLRVIDKHPCLMAKPKAFVIGADTVRNALNAAGVEVVFEPAEAGVVIVGRDPHMTFAQLNSAAQAIVRGVPLLALNLDVNFPGENGVFMLGPGAIVSALTTATGIEPEVVGKPSAFYFQEALRIFSIAAADTAMVGDSLDSDIAGGASTGLTTVLVGDGREQAKTNVKPDVHVPNLRALHHLITNTLP